MHSIYYVLVNTLGIDKFSVSKADVFQIDWLKSVLSNKIAGKT